MTVKLFGRSDVAASAFAVENYIVLSKWTASATGRISEIRCRVKASTTGNIILGIYSDNAGQPSTLLATTASTAITSGAEREVTVALVSNINVASGTVCWIAANSSVSLIARVTETGTYWYKVLTYGTLPSSAGTGYTEDTLYNQIASAYGDVIIAITGSGIASAEAEGTGTFRATIKGAGVASLEAEGTGVVQQSGVLIGAGIPSAFVGGIGSLALVGFWPSVTFKILIDWDNDSTYSNPYSDVTEDLLTCSFDKGGDFELALADGGKAQAGQLDLTLKNPGGKYSPELLTSPLSGSLNLNVSIKLLAYSPNEVVLFTGKVYRITPHPELDNQTCYIYATDGFDVLAHTPVKVALQTDIYTGEAIDLILTAAGFGTSLIDRGFLSLPYWGMFNDNALEEIKNLEDAERGFFYINQSGQPVFESRYHRWNHTTSLATFDNNMRVIGYDFGLDSVVNQAEVDFTTKAIAASADIWTCGEILEIDIGDTLVIDAPYGLATDIIDPEEDTDYTANTQADGLGTPKSSDVTVTLTKYGKGSIVTIINGAVTPVFMTLLKIRGSLISDSATTTRKEIDQDSIDSYNYRPWSLSNPNITSSNDAIGLGEFAVRKDKAPRVNKLTITLRNKNNILWPQLVSRTISDRITIINTRLGLSGDYLINSMHHDITQGGLLHEVTWICEDASFLTGWTLDEDALAESTVLV